MHCVASVCMGGGEGCRSPDLECFDFLLFVTITMSMNQNLCICVLRGGQVEREGGRREKLTLSVCVCVLARVRVCVVLTIVIVTTWRSMRVSLKICISFFLHKLLHVKAIRRSVPGIPSQ